MPLLYDRWLYCLVRFFFHATTLTISIRQQDDEYGCVPISEREACIVFCYLLSVNFSLGLHGMAANTVFQSVTKGQDDWQGDKTVLQCNKHMFQQQINCDVTFQFGKGTVQLRLKISFQISK